jgi:hypothetical protein
MHLVLIGDVLLHMALPNNPLEESQFLDLLSKQLALFQSNWLCFKASVFF